MPTMDGGTTSSDIALKTGNGRPYEDLERVPSDLSCGLKGKSHLWQDFVSRVLYLPSSSSCTTCQHLVSREGTPLKATVRWTFQPLKTGGKR